jgi:hypothetical protein
MATSKAENILSKIIEYGAKIETIAPMLLPAGFALPAGVSIGLQVVKFVANEINQARANNAPEIVLPDDAELINRLRSTAQRIASKGQAFLDSTDSEDEDEG